MGERLGRVRDVGEAERLSDEDGARARERLRERRARRASSPGNSWRPETGLADGLCSGPGDLDRC